MSAPTRFRLNALFEQGGVRQLIAVGATDGQLAGNALALGYQVPTPHGEPYEHNQPQLGQAPLSTGLGKSDDFLLSVAASSATPRLFWLNAESAEASDVTLSRQLEIVLEKDTQQDWLIIENARVYVEGMFGGGKCPEHLQKFAQAQDLQARFAGLVNTHNLLLCRQDAGYFVFSPKTARLPAADIIKVLPTDLPGEQPGLMNWAGGVLGCTSISVARRIRDHRFTTRYFKGFGLDVGCGNDSIALYAGEFFPLIRNIATYDMPQGDAQKLANVDDNSFDFLYSSHCLEHLRDAREALQNWIRVVKPGGYLIVQIPDEDLYEQGFWPSRYNSDHKISFTIAKKTSWSPVSVNVIDLLSQFVDQVAILQLGLEDAGYQYRLQPYKFDQTRTPMAESAIEFVLQKRQPSA